jgi:flagellar biogenesis protein FliO
MEEIMGYRNSHPKKPWLLKLFMALIFIGIVAYMLIRVANGGGGTL